MKILITLILSLIAVNLNAAQTQSFYDETKTSIIASSNNAEFTIKLKSNPTTGYKWFLSYYNDNLIRPVKQKYLAPTSQLVGAPGYELWTFQVKSAAFTVPQLSELQFVYARPWDVDNTQPLTFKVSTISAPLVYHSQK